MNSSTSLVFLYRGNLQVNGQYRRTEPREAGRLWFFSWSCPYHPQFLALPAQIDHCLSLPPSDKHIRGSRSLPSRVSSPTAGKYITRRPWSLASIDQLHDDDRLSNASAAERAPPCPPLSKGQIQKTKIPRLPLNPGRQELREVIQFQTSVWVRGELNGIILLRLNRPRSSPGSPSHTRKPCPLRRPQLAWSRPVPLSPNLEPRC